MEPPRLRYDCDLSRLGPEHAARFLQLAPDADTHAFLSFSERTRHGQLRGLSFGVLRRVLTDYQAYGLLGMYRLHLLSAAQYCALLDLEPNEPCAGAFLDVGAGRGDASAGLCAHFPLRFAIEPATALQRSLRARGFRLLALDLCTQPLPPEPRFDLITCLNVIDRVAFPRTLLRNAVAALTSQGRLVISVPLPLRPHVDRGGSTVAQEEPLPAVHGAFESQALTLIEELLPAVGLRLERFSRAPYLSQGDATAPYYVLDDLILVCRPSRS